MAYRNIIENVFDNYIRYKVRREDEISFSVKVTLYFYLLTFLIVMGMFIVFHSKDWDKKVDSNFQSTLNLKIRESISTIDIPTWYFNKSIVRSDEYKYYKRIWDPVSYAFQYPDEIQVMTNMAITPNQRQGLCADSYRYPTDVCDPNLNECKHGHYTQNGRQTGRCVLADVPDNQNKTYTCQIQGWCPAARFWPPLVDFQAVLGDTANKNLSIKNTLYFPDKKLVIDNQHFPGVDYFNCLYNTNEWSNEKNPNCPVFSLRDLVSCSTNCKKQTYESMSKFGATINIVINWKCDTPLLWWQFDKTRDCRVSYEFRRIDGEHLNSPTGPITYPFVLESHDGQSRTFINSFRMRFTIQVNAVLLEYSFFNLILIYSSYVGVITTFFAFFDQMVRMIVKDYDHDTVTFVRRRAVDVGVQTGADIQLNAIDLENHHGHVNASDKLLPG